MTSSNLFPSRNIDSTFYRLKPSSIRIAADANLLLSRLELAVVGSTVHPAAAAPAWPPPFSSRPQPHPSTWPQPHLSSSDRLAAIAQFVPVCDHTLPLHLPEHGSCRTSSGSSTSPALRLLSFRRRLFCRRCSALALAANAPMTRSSETSAACARLDSGGVVGPVT